MRIRQLVARIDEQHREAMRTVADDVAARQAAAGTPDVEASRRRFVRNLGLGSVAAVGVASAPALLLSSTAAAQSSSSSDVELPAADLAFVDFAVGLELAVENAYTTAAATRLFDSAQVELAHTFARHHHEQAVALATVAGRDADTVGFPNPTLVNELTPEIDGAADANALLEILYGLEESMAATYQQALGELESRDVSGPVGTILPVDAQQAVAIGSLLGLPVDQWMPSFQSTDGAFDPARYAG